MKKLIYLAGAVTGLTKEEQNEWRNRIRNMVDDSDYDFECVNPCDFIPDEIDDDVEKEMFEWDLWKLKQSSIVVCDFDHPQSIGTTWELAVAKELGIPIVGLKTKDVPVHPWWKMSAIHICSSIPNLYWYLRDYFFSN